MPCLSDEELSRIEQQIELADEHGTVAQVVMQGVMVGNLFDKKNNWQSGQ